MPFRSFGLRAKHVTPSSCGKAAMNGFAKILHISKNLSDYVCRCEVVQRVYYILSRTSSHQPERLPTCQASQH